MIINYSLAASTESEDKDKEKNVIPSVYFCGLLCLSFKQTCMVIGSAILKAESLCIFDGL